MLQSWSFVVSDPSVINPPLSSMNRENQPLVINEPVEFSKLLVQVQDFIKTPILLEEYMEYTSNQ